ncbi:MAG: hypothetical protein IKQ91_00235 [Oscillospiraceae bacterium]|nr:hypothetical protein [Oscillospiraceae bacterium]
MESGYSAPQSFSNDKATLTIDTMLYDGHAALAVVTIEAHDPAFTFPHDYGFIPEIVCDAEGNALEIDLDEGIDNLNPCGFSLVLSNQPHGFRDIKSIALLFNRNSA